MKAEVFEIKDNSEQIIVHYSWKRHYCRQEALAALKAKLHMTDYIRRGKESLAPARKDMLAVVDKKIRAW